MTTHRFVMRFLGRFVFACKGDPAKPTEIVALAVNMDYNKDLGSPCHRLRLAAPRWQSQILGDRRADITVFPPTREPDPWSQILIWNLDGFDVAPSAVVEKAITLTGWTTVPAVDALASGAFDAALASRPLAPGGPVTARFRFTAGDVTAIQFDPAKRVSFEPFVGGGTSGTPVPLPDVVDVAFSVSDNLQLDLTGQQPASSIVLTPPKVEPTVITISNLCTAGGSDDSDPEFAAYYDVLQAAPYLPQRLIPYASGHLFRGAKADCTGVGRVTY